ncbi:MAG: peptidase domain-containing ABC transporter [Cyanobacteria bacterium P01_G01_bin.54]
MDSDTMTGLARLPKAIQGEFQPVQFPMGSTLLVAEQLPAQVLLLTSGQARLLIHDPRSQRLVPLARLEAGAWLGANSLIRNVPGEAALASTEILALALPAPRFLELLVQYPDFAGVCGQPTLSEVAQVLLGELSRRADGMTPVRELALAAMEQAQLWQSQNRLASKRGDRQDAPKDPTPELIPDFWSEPAPPTTNVMNSTTAVLTTPQPTAGYAWFISGGKVFPEQLYTKIDPHTFELAQLQDLRLLGLPVEVLPSHPQSAQSAVAAPAAASSPTASTSPLAPDPLPLAPQPVPPPTPQTQQSVPPAPLPVAPNPTPNTPPPKLQKYPYTHGSGPLHGTLACFKMLTQFLDLPYRPDVMRRVLQDRLRQDGALSLEFCAAIGDLLGLQVQLTNCPAEVLTRVPTPALLAWEDSFAILYETHPNQLVIGIPAAGVQRYPPAEVQSLWGQEGPVLLLQRTLTTPKQRFGLSWFMPAVSQYRRVLLEVFLASFFVQLFALVNPLMTQQIIDKVIVQEAPDSLPTFGLILLVVGVFESLLTVLRTYLFVDTTNRIDYGLGSQIIDHLLRLPLGFFGRRPVGELTSRVNELENIRQFLTGTALTVVLDALFSVVYVAILFFYSVKLALVALAVVPLFILLTILLSPEIRRRLRVKAERNAATQSHLVEVLSGMETVKAQNIELKSRMAWQQRYGRYVIAGFRAIQLSTVASALSGFLNKFSGLLVLWAGAYLVIAGEMTLGELIAFRIIAGYVTSPLLRLSQLWQNFQETALSLERLSDIVDHPQEAEADARGNLPMPLIQGAIAYDQVSFRFGNSGPLQLDNVSLEIPTGAFVGIVGLSGSGKSTLTKLLPRLYHPLGGRILVDGYDIHKVELYSLRRQIGIVPQNTLLFEGTVQENIALTNPDATFEEIVRAAQIAVAHDFIMELPAGYNSLVGERGSNLSGGQRQRVAIARTILQDPRLLIMDEATSALDYDTESQVCRNLVQAFKGRTVLFITHRLRTIQDADRIVMMGNGMILEQGTHEELMQLQGSYYCLYRQQD